MKLGGSKLASASKNAYVSRCKSLGNDENSSKISTSVAAYDSKEYISEIQDWFRHHVKLGGEPYFLDQDQARAVTDLHQNTLVTARAGSGKTRVIVAKVAYLISRLHYDPREIAVFMFNRTAAVEVNERITSVEIDGQPLFPPGETYPLASTFHKFALDLMKESGARPELISESEQNALITQLLREATAGKYHFSPRVYQELAKLTSGFITRAGQKFPGRAGLTPLMDATYAYLKANQHLPDKHFFCQVHRIALEVYTRYLQSLQPPRTDFNLLMSNAADLLSSAESIPRLGRLKYLMVDEYQDFSDLFYNLIQAIRMHCPSARLFAVGDDWQAINRFAGSDVNYFLDFARYFPVDSANIPLATNYRSCRRIVENANRYMLTNYDPNALPAAAHNHKTGKIYHLNPAKIRFDTRDSLEDGLGDGFYQQILAEVLNLPNPSKVPFSAAKLLKTLTKICHKHRSRGIMLLHRHNFTSINGLTLDTLATALCLSLDRQIIMPRTDFARQVRFLTMHRSKGLESEVVIILEADAEIIASAHPHATIFEIFGDTRAAEIADQQRLLYVAMTRAKERLYILSSDKKPLI